jgi:hypothetical protein
MTLRRDIDAVRRVVAPAGDPPRPLRNDEFADSDGKRWRVIGLEGGPVVFLPELDPTDPGDGLAGFLALGFADGREPR